MDSVIEVALSWKYGFFVTPISMGGISVSLDVVLDFRKWDWRSWAKRVIMTNRCSKAAGLDALSAFWVARRSKRRFGAVALGSCSNAEDAIRRWAVVGGLKDESRT